MVVQFIKFVNNSDRDVEFFSVAFDARKSVIPNKGEYLVINGLTYIVLCRFYEQQRNSELVDFNLIVILEQRPILFR